MPRYLVAPIELVRLTRRKAQRNMGINHPRLVALPGTGIAPDRVVAALISEFLELFENADQGQALATRLRLVGRKQPILVEMFALRGVVFSHEAVREWEAKLTPLWPRICGAAVVNFARALMIDIQAVRNR
jgi:hypothetical protein